MVASAQCCLSLAQCLCCLPAAAAAAAALLRETEKQLAIFIVWITPVRCCCWPCLSQGGRGGEKLAPNAPLAKFHNWISANSVFTRISKCKMHVLLQGFANVLSQKYLGFARICKYDLAGFRKFSRTFANMVLQCFIIFCKVTT